ncbi:MAG TPA: response regulator [bacterium]|nr:response regulator [bacterium]
MIGVGVIYHLALLVALSTASGFVSQRWLWRRSGAVLQGLIFGCAAGVGMLAPLALGDGLVFDGRSIVLSLCGLFFGPVAGTSGGGMAVAARLLRGGDDTLLTEILIILLSTVLGALFYLRRSDREAPIGTDRLLFFGLLVHVASLLLLYTLPFDIALLAIKRVGAVFLFAAPLVTALVGRILSDDVSRLRLVEDLRKHKERFRTFFDATADIVTLKDAGGRYLMANRAQCAFLGKKEGDLLGRRDLDLLPEETALRYLRSDQEVLRTKKDMAYHEKVGDRVYEVRKFPVPLREGGLGVGAFVRDITDRERAEGELRESTARSAAILRSVPDLIFLISRDGVFLDYHANDPMLLFAPPQRLLGRHISAVFSPEFAEKLETALAMTLLTDEIRSIEYEEESGETVRCHEMRLVRSGEEAVFMIVRDISDRRRAETDIQEMKELLEERVRERTAQLEEANRRLREARTEAERASKAKSIFLASMSHEIRTPMNAILGYVQLLRRSEPLTGIQREHLSTVLRSGEHLLDLINQILELSKIEAGRITLNPVDLDLPRLLADLRDMFLPQAVEKGLRFEVRQDGAIPRYINADAIKVRQVLINLVGNAMKFTKRGGITLLVRDDGPTFYGNDHLITVEVADTGPGMTPEELSRMFDPFEQTGSGARSGGTGLGLTLSKQFASLMEGTLSARSEPGRGTVVSFSFRALPATAAAATARTRSPMKRLPPGLLYKVLIVDDNASNRDILRILLTEGGFITHEAKDGREAIAVFWKWRPDLVFMDLQMPEMDGREAIRRIRESPEGKTIPIIVITADPLEETRREMLAAGATGFIRKPFREEELCDAVMKALDIPCDPAPVAEEPRPPAVPPPGVSEAPLRVPDAIRRELHAAVVKGDTGEMLRLLGSLGEGDRPVADRLRALVDDFSYETLLELTEDAHD